MLAASVRVAGERTRAEEAQWKLLRDCSWNSAYSARPMPLRRRDLHPAAPRQHQEQELPPVSRQVVPPPPQPQQPQQSQQESGRLAVSSGSADASAGSASGREGFELVPTSAVGVYQDLFPYPSFNPVQSACFARTYKSDDSMLVSAPTGSGKTGIMEIAICRLIASAAVTGGQLEAFSVVYFGASAMYSRRLF